MTALEKIAYYQNRRDEIPNQELAHLLAFENDLVEIKLISENFWNQKKNIRCDCWSVNPVAGQINFLLLILVRDLFMFCILNSTSPL